MATKKSRKAAKRLIGSSRRVAKDISLSQQVVSAQENGTIGSSVKEVSNQDLLEELKEKAHQSRKHRVKKRDSFEWNQFSKDAQQRDRHGAPKPKYTSAFNVGDMAKTKGSFRVPDGTTCMIVSEIDCSGYVETLVEGRQIPVNVKNLRPIGWEKE